MIDLPVSKTAASSTTTVNHINIASWFRDLRASSNRQERRKDVSKPPEAQEDGGGWLFLDCRRYVDENTVAPDGSKAWVNDPHTCFY